MKPIPNWFQMSIGNMPKNIRTLIWLICLYDGRLYVAFIAFYGRSNQCYGDKSIGHKAAAPYDCSKGIFLLNSKVTVSRQLDRFFIAEKVTSLWTDLRLVIAVYIYHFLLKNGDFRPMWYCCRGIYSYKCIEGRWWRVWLNILCGCPHTCYPFNPRGGSVIMAPRSDELVYMN